MYCVNKDITLFLIAFLSTFKLHKASNLNNSDVSKRVNIDISRRTHPFSGLVTYYTVASDQMKACNTLSCEQPSKCHIGLTLDKEGTSTSHPAFASCQANEDLFYWDSVYVEGMCLGAGCDMKHLQYCLAVVSVTKGKTESPTLYAECHYNPAYHDPYTPSQLGALLVILGFSAIGCAACYKIRKRMLERRQNCDRESSNRNVRSTIASRISNTSVQRLLLSLFSGDNALPQRPMSASDLPKPPAYSNAPPPPYSSEDNMKTASPGNSSDDPSTGRDGDQDAASSDPNVPGPSRNVDDPPAYTGNLPLRTSELDEALTIINRSNLESSRNDAVSKCGEASVKRLAANEANAKQNSLKRPDQLKQGGAETGNSIQEPHILQRIHVLSNSVDGNVCAIEEGNTKKQNNPESNGYKDTSLSHSENDQGQRK